MSREQLSRFDGVAPQDPEEHDHGEQNEETQLTPEELIVDKLVVRYYDRNGITGVGQEAARRLSQTQNNDSQEDHI